MVLTTFSGSSIGGYFNPQWPIIGPLVQRLTTWQAEHPEGLTEVGIAKAVATEVTGQLRDRMSDRSAVPAGFNQGTIPAQLASSVRTTPQSQVPTPQRPNDKLLIATFNIQVFGKSKLADRNVLNALSEIIRQFDVIAIQEIRAKEDNILPEFVAAINADGSQYDFIIGPRLGRSVSTEQYAYVFDRTRVECDRGAVGTVIDSSDQLHREPYVARFRSRTQSPQDSFTFWLVNIHTDPDEVQEEVSALADVFMLMQQARADEDDVILLGDLNASESQLGRLGQVPGIRWVVNNAMTNTRQNKAYDNILFHSQATAEFSGRWGVFDVETTYGLTRDQALLISDHLPVWAEFSVWESPPNVSPTH